VSPPDLDVARLHGSSVPFTVLARNQIAGARHWSP
jgi:hypothetical protein